MRPWPVIAFFWPFYQTTTEALKTGNVFIHCRAGPTVLAQSLRPSA